MRCQKLCSAARPSLSSRALSLVVAGLLCLVALPAGAASLAVTQAAANTGTYGLEVHPSTTCTGTDEAVLAGITVTGVQSFEGCNSVLAESNFVVASGGDATISAGQRIVFGNGFRVEQGGSLTVRLDESFVPFAFVQDDSPGAETTYDLEFYANFEGLELDMGDEIEHFTAYSAGGEEPLKLLIRQNVGLEIVLTVLEEDGTRTETAAIALQAGWNRITASWTAQAAATASLSVNGGTPEILSGLNTASFRIDFVRWGVVAGVFTKNPGVLFQDDFLSLR